MLPTLLFEDGVMLLSRHRREEDGPSALFASNLLLSAASILINLEVDDSAVIEKAPCDCEYTRVGFHLQVRDIFSYGKVTAQGMTVEAASLLQILEEQLPAHFGGAPGDYQLAEVEGSTQTQIVLRVSPRLSVQSPSDIHEFFLNHVAKLHGGHLSVRVWSFSGGFQVVREEPELTYTGKVHPLRLSGAGATSLKEKVTRQ
jgi:hypothetical protein